MADTVDRATRSRIMRAIKSRDTKPERLMSETLKARRIRFRRDAKELPGTPDFLVCEYLAVFVHGCFWHLCPRHYKGVDPARIDWAQKMERNRLRDQRVRRQLRRMGYQTMVVWEHEDPARAARRVERRLTRP